MYPITNAVKALFEAEQTKVLRITGTDKNGAVISITDDDVRENSFEIDRYSCNGQMLEIGTAISAQLSMKLENTDGRYDSIVFEGAELFVEIGIADWTQANPTITWVPCGYFTPDIQPRKMTTISITALDRMMWFENVSVLLHPWTTQSGEIIRDSAGEPIYFVSNASLVFPCTVAELVGRVCALCNVPFSQNLSGLPNHNYSITELLVTDQSVTFRDVIKWCAGIMGTNAWIDWSGSLRFSWYNNDTGYVSTVDNRLSSDLYENAIVITGVKCTLPDDESTMYIAGSNDYAIDLTGNNLINADNVQTLLQGVYNALNAFAYTPFSANVIAAPYLWPMDRIVFTDKNGNGHVSALTNVNLSLNGSTALSAVGESLKAYSYGTPGSFTLQQQAAMQKWRSNVVADTRAAVDNASAQITGANGGYVRFMYDENGVMTEILIMNTPDIATATKVWRWNSGGFGYSSNGYQGPFTTAITQDGSIVANFITTGVLNADLILAGTMSADRISGGVIDGETILAKLLNIVNEDGDTIAKLEDILVLGKSGNTNVIINDNSLVMKDKNGNEYFSVKDLRNEAGYVEYTESVTVLPWNYPQFYPNITPYTIVSVYWDDVMITDYVDYGDSIRILDTKSTESTLTVTYRSNTPVYNIVFGNLEDSSQRGAYSSALGDHNTLKGNYSIVAGYTNQALSHYCAAFGRNTKAAYCCLSFGHGSDSSGGYAFAGGYFCIASGLYSHAEGNQTTASGRDSHAEGNQTTASGQDSHAEGNNTTASNTCSHAEGNYSIASGQYSHAEGNQTNANGNASHAEGRATIADYNYQHVSGKYNISGDNAEIIGNGTSTENRSNARTLDWFGNEWIAGTLTQASDSRLKEESGEVPDLSDIRARRFKWNDKKGSHDDLDHIGYFAQDVEKVAPYLVQEDAMGYKSLDYIALLCAKVEQLERRVQQLEEEVKKQ